MGKGLAEFCRALECKYENSHCFALYFHNRIIGALIVTLSSVSFSVQVIAIISVTPILILSAVFICFCRQGKAWSFAGASILGALGVILRVVVSTQPNLEVGGGLPVGVTALYIVIGVLLR